MDANTFASLCVLNRHWNQASSVVELYAYHLSRCPSFALSNNVITGPFRRFDLERLKTRFAAEVRRNLFEVFLQPRRTLINLVSVSASSSTAFPGGEAFRFRFSPNGQTILALSSSRIYILDATTTPIRVRRELTTLRKVLTASVTDDGTLLATLSSKSVVNVYSLTPTSIKYLKVIVLDNPPVAICLAHQGTVLAVSYQAGGVEVFSLAANALQTDRRAVRCEAVDYLDFSGDSSMLIGSSKSIEDPNAVVISAPFYAEPESNASPRELHSRQWTTQILFPNNSSTCSHTTLVPNHTEADAAWLFAFDHTLTSYRTVRTDDTRTGIAYFLSPPSPRRYSGLPFPSMPPSVSGCGDLVVAGFQNVGLCLYGIPQRLDMSPDMGSVVERHESKMRGPMALTSATGNVEPLMAYSPSVSGSSESFEEDPLASRVDWRSSLFVKGRFLHGMDGISAAKWIEQPVRKPDLFPQRRLVAVAPGGVGSKALGDEDMPVDGSRLMMFDFSYSPAGSTDQEFTIEVGNDEAEILPEQQGNLDVEIAIERHRSVRDTRRGQLGRSITSITPPDILRRGTASQPTSPVFQSVPDFSPMTPRSQDSLQRAVTAAGFHNARYPPRPPLGLNQNSSRRQSNDSWTTPPPPYSNAGSPGNRPRRSTPTLPLPSPSPLPGDTLNTIQASMHIPMPPASPDMYSAPVRHMTDPVRNVSEPVSPPRRSSTGPETPVSALSPMVSAISPGMSALSPVILPSRPQRQRNFSDRNLETVAEQNPLQGVMNYFPGKGPTIRRRPVGDHPNIILPQPSATISHPISPPTPDRSPQELIEDSASLTITEHSRHSPRVSLSGNNLRDRLNRPVPPPPNNDQQVRDHPGYIPPTLQPGYFSEPAVLARGNAEPFTPTSPNTNGADYHVANGEPWTQRPSSPYASPHIPQPSTFDPSYSPPINPNHNPVTSSSSQPPHHLTNGVSRPHYQQPSPPNLTPVGSAGSGVSRSGPAPNPNGLGYQAYPTYHLHRPSPPDQTVRPPSQPARLASYTTPVSAPVPPQPPLPPPMQPRTQSQSAYAENQSNYVTHLDPPPHIPQRAATPTNSNASSGSRAWGMITRGSGTVTKRKMRKELKRAEESRDGLGNGDGDIDNRPGTRGGEKKEKGGGRCVVM